MCAAAGSRSADTGTTASTWVPGPGEPYLWVLLVQLLTPMLARFEEKARPPSLWIEDLREEDAGLYRCRVDFRQAPTKNFKIRLDVIGEH